MKLLLDQGVPYRAAELLRSAGHDCLHVGECGLEAATDHVIVQKGRDEQRVVVTMDADHHTIVALAKAISPSVIRFRIEHLKAAELTTLLLSVIAECADDLNAGALVTVQAARVRVRRLPLALSE